MPMRMSVVWKQPGKHWKKDKPGQSISVFIGPEGGFSEEEIDTLRQDAEVLSLGKRILRTDTAAICAMSMLMLELERKNGGRMLTMEAYLDNSATTRCSEAAKIKWWKR